MLIATAPGRHRWDQVFSQAGLPAKFHPRNRTKVVALSIVMQDVEGVPERVTELPFSPVAGNILQHTRDERMGAREIARIIAHGQGLTARLLK